MLSDAVSTIRSDTTAIDKLKGISFEERKDEGLRCVLVCRVRDRVYFGGDGHFSWRWLVPVAPRFRYLEELRGYRVECFEVWCVCFALLLSVFEHFFECLFSRLFNHLFESRSSHLFESLNESLT